MILIDYDWKPRHRFIDEQTVCVMIVMRKKDVYAMD